MAVTGVICEYNPFHNGHAAMLAQLRQQGADTVVCIMSGNFVQRGDAAIVDKFARAEMAVRGGADLVIELPTPWAMATAETFAKGGVQLLHMALCDAIGFGSECGDIAALKQAAEVVSHPDFRRDVRWKMADGTPYAAARQAVAEEKGVKPGLLRSPNDILAVEYLKAIRQLKVDITSIPIPRIGSAHDGAPVLAGECEGGIASASYVREQLKQGDLSALGFLPEYAAEILRREMAEGRGLVDITLAERAILDRMLRLTEEDFSYWDDGGEGLYHRVYQAVRSATGWNALLEAVKTKRYPTARLRRMLLAIWLQPLKPMTQPPYLRVLAANETGRRHLRRLQDAGKPVLTKAADVDALGLKAEMLLEQEAMHTDLYQLCRPCIGAPGQGWRSTPRMV